MSKAKGVLKGFITAAVVCVVSFLVIYFVFPDVSEKFFKMSFKHRNGRAAVEDLGERAKDAAIGVVKDAADKAGNEIDKGLDKAGGIVDKVLVKKASDKVGGIVRSIKNKFN